MAFFSFFTPAFMPAFFAFFTRRAILRFSARTFFIAALCSLLPFLYLDIFLFRARICFSSAESTFFSFFTPAFIPFFMPAFFAFLTRFAILPFSFFIALIAALCSLLPFLYFFIFALRASMAFFS